MAKDFDTIYSNIENNMTKEHILGVVYVLAHKVKKDIYKENLFEDVEKSFDKDLMNIYNESMEALDQYGSKLNDEEQKLLSKIKDRLQELPFSSKTNAERCGDFWVGCRMGCKWF
ncbi:MAG TPA: hypothetical protein DHM42_11355 [Clostridiales bacterium]|nr:hypothetical protein [Clostridiales bacterium]